MEAAGTVGSRTGTAEEGVVVGEEVGGGTEIGRAHV